MFSVWRLASGVWRLASGVPLFDFDARRFPHLGAGPDLVVDDLVERFRRAALSEGALGGDALLNLRCVDDAADLLREHVHELSRRLARSQHAVPPLVDVIR